MDNLFVFSNKSKTLISLNDIRYCEVEDVRIDVSYIGEGTVEIYFDDKNSARRDYEKLIRFLKGNTHE
jgi:hypothetical protein